MVVGPHIKAAARGAIADRRNSAIVRAAARASEITLNAVRNQYNWDFAVNGEAWTLRRCLPGYPGAVFDVGSNRGQWALQALRYLDGRPLHCFEAVPATCAELRRTLPPSADVTVNAVALGSTAGTADFNYCRTTSDVSSRYAIPPEFRDRSTESVAVRVQTGDGYCEERDIDRIAMLKVDVEGMEYEVLEGFASMLDERRVGVVQFEYGTGYIGARRYLGDVCALLEASGYSLFRQFPRELEPFTYTERDEDYRARNFVAVAHSGRAGDSRNAPLGHGSAQDRSQRFRVRVPRQFRRM